MEVGVFLGAFLGFVSGLAVQVAWTWWNRREQAVLYRNVASVEVLNNLEALDGMLESVGRTEAGGYVISETTISRPRADVLRAIAADADLMRSLTEDERVTIPQAVSHIDRVLAEYAQWPDSLGGTKGSIQVRLPDGSVKLSREVSTMQLRDTLTTVMKVQIGLVVGLVISSPKARLRPRQPLQAIHEALRLARKGRPSRGPFQVAVRLPETLTDVDASKPLVVWRANGSARPGTVVVLSDYGG